jgi:hypothetical protein
LLIELAYRGGPQSYKAGVLVAIDLRHWREQLAVEDDADLPAHVVEHAVGVDGAVALAEDDVAFHVNLERQVARLGEVGGIRAQAGRPDDGAVGFDVDVAKRAEDGRDFHAFHAEALDDDVYAAGDHERVLAGSAGRHPFGFRTEAFRTREDLHTAERRAPRRRGRHERPRRRDHRLVGRRRHGELSRSHRWIVVSNVRRGGREARDGGIGRRLGEGDQGGNAKCKS